MKTRGPDKRDLDFYYFDFLRELRRYRTHTLLGWLIVLVGASGVFLGWTYGRPHGLMDIVLSGCTVLAGLLVVNQAVMSLQSYVNVPFQERDDIAEADHPAVVEIRRLMRDMNEGGWWEANLGIKELEEIATRCSLKEGSGEDERPSEREQDHPKEKGNG